MPKDTLSIGGRIYTRSRALALGLIEGEERVIKTYVTSRRKVKVQPMRTKASVKAAAPVSDEAPEDLGDLED